MKEELGSMATTLASPNPLIMAATATMALGVPYPLHKHTAALSLLSTQYRQQYDSVFGTKEAMLPAHRIH